MLEEQIPRDQIRKDLYSIGSDIGQWLIDEYLVNHNVKQCKSFKDSMENII